MFTLVLFKKWHDLDNTWGGNKFDQKIVRKNQGIIDFKTFLKELKKKKVTLSLTQQDEWEEYFESYQKDLLELQAQIDKTDKR